MKQTFILLGLCSLLFACDSGKLKQLEAERDALKSQLDAFEGEKDLVKGEYSEAIETLNAIEDTLRAISSREKEIADLAGSKDMSGNLSQRQAILERLENLKKANEESNKQARQLQGTFFAL